MLNLLSLGENGWGTLILSATLTTLLLSLAALAVGAGGAALSPPRSCPATRQRAGSAPPGRWYSAVSLNYW